MEASSTKAAKLSFGRRRLMFAALAVFIVASLLCAASTSIVLLTLARLLQGLGGGGLMTLSQALVGEAFPPRECDHTVIVCAALQTSERNLEIIGIVWLAVDRHVDAVGAPAVWIPDGPGLVRISVTDRNNAATVEAWVK